MKNIKWNSITMLFREKVYDEEGNLIVNAKTGKPQYQLVSRVVRYNAYYRFK